MQIERRALYNSLRMNWTLDPSIEVENWQIQNYRELPLDHLFDLLKKFKIDLDRNHFVAIADTCDTPEDFTDYLIGEEKHSVKTEDQIYLIVFELWRRLIPEKPSLSIFCDELDHQINLFDHGKVSSFEALQDAITNLETILTENVDEGVDPHEAFDTVSSTCAHDIETFLYDFTAEQIDVGNFSYAEELLESFSHSIKDVKWFDFLHAQVIATTNVVKANLLLKELVEEHSEEADLEFNLEVLSFMSREGEQELFIRLVKQSINLIEREEDFQDLITTCADFCHFLDQEDAEQMIHKLLEERIKRPLDGIVEAKDPDLVNLIKIMEKTVKYEKRSI